jgi:hypothetical protein
MNRPKLRISLARLGLLLAPAAGAHAQVAVTSPAVQEHDARPGERYQGTIRVRNTTGRPQQARIYLADYAFQADGVTRYGAPGSSPRSNAAWITVSPSSVTVPAGQEVTVAYSVAVPEGRPLTGTFWSMVMVEALGDGAPAAGAPRGARVSLGVRPTIRYGVQVATTIAGTGTRKAEFAGTRAEGSAAGKALEFDVLNSGDLAFRPALRLELFDEQGAPAGKFEAKRGLVYPGTSVRQRFELGALPAGTYQALVVADTGGDEVFGARYRLKL